MGKTNKRYTGVTLDPELYERVRERIGDRSFSRVVEECLRGYFPIYEALDIKGKRPFESLEKCNANAKEKFSKDLVKAFIQVLEKYSEQGGSKHE